MQKLLQKGPSTRSSTGNSAASMGQQARTHVQVITDTNFSVCMLCVCLLLLNSRTSLTSLFPALQTKFSFQSMKTKLGEILEQVQKLP